MRPLADEIRPQTLDEVAGQKHLLGEGALLRRLIESGNIPNMIFYGQRDRQDHCGEYHRQADQPAVIHPERNHRLHRGY